MCVTINILDHLWSNFEQIYKRIYEMNVQTVDTIMQNTKLVNIGEFTKEDWNIFMNGSRAGRIMMTDSLDAATKDGHIDALTMLEGTMGYNEFGG